MDTTTNLKDEQALSLLKAYHEGDETAFSTLYNMYIRMLLNYGRCITTDNELVKDCVHDVFMKLLDRTHIPHITKMSSYLVISLRNRLVDEFRRATFTTETAVEEVRVGQVVADVEHDYLVGERTIGDRQEVGKLLDCLTPRQRTAFQLYYLEERKYDEICRLMNMNYHSVRNLVHRGMLKLRAAAVC